MNDPTIKSSNSGDALTLLIKDSLLPQDVAVLKDTQESVYTLSRPSSADRLSTLEHKDKNGLVVFEETRHLKRYHDTPAQRRNQYVTSETKRSLARLNRQIDWLDLLNKDEKPDTIDVGDMSRADGKAYGKHKLHRQGTSVDMRPVTQTYTHRALGAFNKNPNYSRDKTQVLVDLLRMDGNVKTIYFNDPAVESVKHAKGHDNHLHVEFNK